jgi:peptidoglycan hydrolase CwlO-like protein
VLPEKEMQKNAEFFKKANEKIETWEKQPKELKALSEDCPEKIEKIQQKIDGEMQKIKNEEKKIEEEKNGSEKLYEALGESV